MSYRDIEDDVSSKDILNRMYRGRNSRVIGNQNTIIVLNKKKKEEKILVIYHSDSIRGANR